MSEKIQKRNSSKKSVKKNRKNISKSKNNQIEKVTFEKEINYEDEYAGLAAKKLPNEKQKPSYYGIKKSGDTNDFKTKWKTEICHYWEMNHYCKYGENCAFAHGENELKNRKLSMNYKTKLCKQFFETGYCPYGSRCQFSHKKEHVYINYINSISDFLKTEKINENYIKRPRLVTFENIYKANFEETKNNRIKLFEDIKNIKKISEDSISTESNENNQIKNINKRNRFMSI